MKEYHSRGFCTVVFEDTIGERGSLQESSSAKEDKIWLGPTGFRLHLNRDQVRALLPYLTRFVETGRIALPAEEEKETP